MCVCFVLDFRNSLGYDHIFLHKSSKLYQFVHTLYEDGCRGGQSDEPMEMETKVQYVPTF